MAGFLTLAEGLGEAAFPLRPGRTMAVARWLLGGCDQLQGDRSMWR